MKLDDERSSLVKYIHLRIMSKKMTNQDKTILCLKLNESVDRCKRLQMGIWSR